MKTQMLTVLSVLFLGMTTGYGQALTPADSVAGKNEPVECVVYTSQDGLLTFRMVKVPEEVVNVGLYDAKGDLLVNRRYKKINNVKLQFDLSECPDGPYEIRVSSHDGIVFSSPVTNPQESLAKN
ncbi:MAG TPA: hypothetical protein PK711_10285 [Bacteroidales bacterium]|nr:hypothetical protein [Bacteroidales bacterium]HRZ22200.1 hypothetical protein [Bacteroidales bacterium]